MGKTSMDFQGVVTLDRALVVQLRDYLAEREGNLTASIAKVFAPVVSRHGHRLSETSRGVLDEIEMAVRGADQHPAGSIQGLVDGLNAPLWNFLEVLEGVTSDLFQQLDLVSVEVWDEKLAELMQELVTLLYSHINSLQGTIKRLEDLLWRYRPLMEGSSPHARWAERVLRLGSSLLDRQLVNQLQETRLFLDMRYKGWLSRYSEYVTYSARAIEGIKQFDLFSILGSLSESSQRLYRFVNRMIRVWELDANSRSILLDDIVRVVREVAQPSVVHALFREYYAAIKDQLFAASRQMKGSEGAVPSVPDLSNARTELTTLLRAVARYREFLLRTDPNPYVRTRWGFAEWVVAPEPESCRQLLQIEYQLEALDHLFEDLIQVLIRKPKVEDRKTSQSLTQDLQATLRSMGQPLTSRHMLQAESIKLMDALERFDELASSSSRSIDTVAEVLSKALRYDSKYSLLFDNAQFHKIYAVHHELALPLLKDPGHVEQLDKTKQGTSRVLKWIEKGHWEKHATEIDQFIDGGVAYFSNLGTRLRATLGTSTRLNSDQRTLVNATRQQLLEFRYALGSFYHRLLSLDAVAQRIRGRCASIDHLIDGIDGFIQETDPVW